MSLEERRLIIDKLGISFTSPDQETDLKVLNNISFVVENGDFVSIVGPSGCGKTTLLNLIAGFEQAQEGRIIYNEQPVLRPSPDRAVVFQSAVLFPWLSVKDNIAFGLKQTGMSKGDIHAMIKNYLGMVKMQGFENYYPEQLSGGMQQRVALARALALKPSMLLMDEPFAALDAQTRLTMQELLMNIRQDLSTTVIFVTHDVKEALYLADRMLVMSRRPGTIIEELVVPFGKSRSLSLHEDPAFVSLKREMLSLVTQQVNHLDIFPNEKIA